MAYEQAAATEYSTSEEVIQAREQLESSYHDLIDIDGYDHERFMGRPAVRQSIDELRFATLEVLAESQQNAYRLIDLSELDNPSIPSISYALYAEDFTSTDDLEVRSRLIKKLNPGKTSISVGDSATVLQS